MAKSSADATSNQITFDFNLAKPVEVDFSAGDVTSDAGVVLVRAADDRMKLTAKVAACIDDQRDPDRVDHQLHDLVRQAIFPKCCGYEDTNDANYTRHSSAFQVVNEREGKPLASCSTMQRFENSVTVDDLLRMQDLLPKLFLSRFKRPKSVSLFMDTTVDPVYGYQQLSFYNGFYKEYCYTDLFCFTDEGFPLGAVVRAGNAAPAEGSLSMLERITGQLRAKRKRMRIHFAADSAFGSEPMYDFCEDNKIDYVIGIGPNHALECLAKPFVEKAKNKYYELFGKPEPLHGKSWRQREERIRYSTKEKGRMQELFERDQRVRVYAEVQYQARTWSRQRRVLVRVDFTEEGADVRFVVTNYTAKSAQWLYENRYCRRARCENNIKELKALRCDKLSCQEYLPNQFRLLDFVFAYILLLEIRSALPRPERNISVQTLLMRFIKIGAVVKSTTRAVKFRLPSSHPWQTGFLACANRLLLAT